MDRNLLEQRLRTFYVTVLILLFVLVGRLWYLQIVQGEYFSHLADGNRMRRVRILPTRGVIFDRNGDVLVRSRPAFTVALVPGGIPQDSHDVLELLSDTLGLTTQEVTDFMNRGRSFPYEPVRLIRDVSPSLVVAIEENRARLPGVFIEEEWVREYLHSDLVSHLLGHLGIISEQELQQHGSRYGSSDLVGKSGLELLFEQQLSGIPGRRTVEVNALSRPIQTIGVIEPVPGHNLVLTIDRKLQRVAEEAFLSHTAQLRDEGRNAHNGAVIAMNPTTGEVLALVSVPSYDPSRLIDASERNSYYNQLMDDSSLPFFNRTLQGQYGPGSAFKPFIAVAMLEERVVRADQVFNATGVSQYGVRDWVIAQRLAPFGNITLNEALAMSSNHYFAEFGAQVGVDRLAPWLREFGFGEPTGIVVLPQEAPGLVPDREWKQNRFAGSPSYDQVWYPTDTEQISIGQGFIHVTPLQLAVGYSAIANRGSIYQPLVIQEVHDPEGQVVGVFEPQLLRQLDVSPSTWNAVIQGMQSVITHPRGTARTAFAEYPLSVAGKTGSYEIPGKDSHGIFGAFSPIEDPELVVIVIVEHGVGGGSAAAPIARKVFDAYFGLEMAEENAGIIQVVEN